MRKTRNRVENAQKCNSNTSICLTSRNEQTCSWRRKKKRWKGGTEKLEIFGPVFCNRNKRSLKSFIWKCSQTGKSDNYCSRTLEICNRVWLHTNHIWELKSVSKKIIECTQIIPIILKAYAFLHKKLLSQHCCKHPRIPFDHISLSRPIF